MGVGLKFWHGDVVAQKVFPLENKFTQDRGKAQGICTAASLAWCKACLRLGRSVNNWGEVNATDHNLNIAMATMRRFDDNPVAQTEMAGLETRGDRAVSSVREMMEMIEASPSQIGIFWTGGHTMGYRYGQHQKEFFDMEQGLFRCKYTAGIKAKIEEGYLNEVIGCRAVWL